MTRDVAILGVGMTRFGELWEISLPELVAEAGLKAVADAGVVGEDIDGLYVASQSASRVLGQEQVGALAVDEAGLADHHIPATRVEAGDASGAVAFRQAHHAIASGLQDIVVVGGVEKMTDVLDDEAQRIMAATLDREWEAFHGATLASSWALMTQAHMREHGTTRDQLSHVPWKNHQHAVNNPLAAYQRALRKEIIAGAMPLSTPLTMLDAAPLVDGAAALVLGPADHPAAGNGAGRPIRIAATEQASDRLALHHRQSMTSVAGTRHAAQRAYDRAGISPDQVDVAEVHDVFGTAELIALEDLDLYKPGKAAQATEDGRTTYDGDLVVNPSGGLKARGHAPGATGLAQLAELTWQLRGDRDAAQVEDARWALAQAMAGTGATAVVTILDGGDA